MDIVLHVTGKLVVIKALIYGGWTLRNFVAFISKIIICHRMKFKLTFTCHLKAKSSVWLRPMKAFYCSLCTTASYCFYSRVLLSSFYYCVFGFEACYILCNCMCVIVIANDSTV